MSSLPDLTTLPLPYPEIQHLLMQNCCELGLDLHLVGGSVRDLLMGRELHDLDYVVSGSSDRLARRVAGPLKAHVVCLDEDFGVMRLILPDGLQLDLTNRQGDTLEDDLARRDCCLNAIALTMVEDGARLEHPRPVDPTGGLADLEARRMRAVSLENLLADPVRILRLLRIAATHTFSLDLETLGWIESRARALKEAPGERVATELQQILARPDAERWVMRLLGLGLLDVLLPEATALRKLVRGPAREPWIFVETLERLRRFDTGIGRFRSEAPEAAARLMAHLENRLPGGTRLDAALRLGLLLLDAGRPWCREVTPDGTYAFPGHVIEGEGRARTASERLRLSGRTTDLVVALVKHQEAVATWRDQPASPVARYRLFKVLGQPPPVSCFSAGEDDWPAARDALIAYLDPSSALTRPTRLLTGDVARKALDLRPGPALGVLLERALEAQLAGAFDDVEGAIAWARKKGAEPDVPPF